ncbi:MAG: AI-2E family transporter [Candidatus Woesearchaeota archaeon]
MKRIHHERLMFFGLFAMLILFTILMIKPFVSAIIGAAILSYIFYPVYLWFNKKLAKSISAMLVILLILLLVTVPVIMIGFTLYREAKVILWELHNADFSVKNCENTPFRGVCAFTRDLSAMLPNFDIKQTLLKLGEFINSYIYTKITALPDKILQIFVMLFLVYFFLVDADLIISTLKNVLTLKKTHEENILSSLKDTVSGVIYGQIIAAIVQGAIAAIGFWLIAGVKSPVTWGIITAFFALLPVFGSGIVWAPVSLYIMFQGAVLEQYGLVVRGIIFFAYGLLIVSTVDNLIKPKIISTKTKIHPVIVMLGVIGGIGFFGLVGIFAGPLLLALLVTFTKIYYSEELTQ